jgi:hypothetical protein
MTDPKLRKWSELTAREQVWRLAIFLVAFLLSSNLLYLIVPSAVLALVYGIACGAIAVWQAPGGRNQPEFLPDRERDASAESEREHEAA